MPRPAAALALLALLPACGLWSREAELRTQLRPDLDAAQLKEIRGADPLVWQTWAISASMAPTPEEALAIVERGEQYYQGQPELTFIDVSLLGQLGRHEEELAAATDALGHGAAGSMVPQLLAFRMSARLQADDPHGAEAEVLALGSVTLDDPGTVAAAWTAVALAYELRGSTEDADAALDHCLDLCPRSLPALRQQAGLDPASVAAAVALVQRANISHPDQPDVRLYLAVQSMLDGKTDEARTQLADLPAPLPPRLVPDVEALYARLDLLAGRVDAALARVRPALDDHPGDAGALAVLMACWRQYGQPEDREFIWRLRRALGRVQDSTLARALQEALKAAEEHAAAADAPAQAPPAEQAAPAQQPPPAEEPAPAKP